MTDPLAADKADGDSAGGDDGADDGGGDDEDEEEDDDDGDYGDFLGGGDNA